MTKLSKMIVLGSGTSAGVPVIGCNCKTCLSEEAKNRRYRASMLLVTDDHKKILIDTAPELRLQMVENKIKEIDSLLISHTHSDHTAGFDDLRAFHFYNDFTLPVYIANQHSNDLTNRFYYHFGNTGYKGVTAEIDLKEFSQGDSINVLGLDIETFPLEHGHILTTAFKVGRFMYATDFKKFSDEQVAKLRGQIDVMVASGIHFGTHGAHSTVFETVDLFKRLGVKRGVITHLSHDIEYLRDSSKLPSGVEFAYDGMVIDL